jgi:hypothetical protein
MRPAVDHAAVRDDQRVAGFELSNFAFERRQTLLVIVDARRELMLCAKEIAHIVDGSGNGDELRSQTNLGLRLAAFEAGETLVRLPEALVRAPYLVADFDQHLRREIDGTIFLSRSHALIPV